MEQLELPLRSGLMSFLEGAYTDLAGVEDVAKFEDVFGRHDGSKPGGLPSSSKY